MTEVSAALLPLRVRPRELLLENRDRVRQICIEHGGLNPRVFGSVARGEDTPDSDIDILVDSVRYPGNGMKLVMLGPDLERFLGCKVDVVVSGALKPRDIEIREEAVLL